MDEAIEIKALILNKRRTVEEIVYRGRVKELHQEELMAYYIEQEMIYEERTIIVKKKVKDTEVKDKIKVDKVKDILIILRGIGENRRGKIL